MVSHQFAGCLQDTFGRNDVVGQLQGVEISVKKMSTSLLTDDRNNQNLLYK